MAAIRPLDGYPDSWGSKRSSAWGHVGPASYVQVVVTPGTIPVVGGDTVQAVEGGLKYFDKLYGGTTPDGAFTVSAIPITAPTTVGAPSATMRLKWVANFTAAFGGQNQTAGSEVVAGTNLSSETVLLDAIGPK